VAAVSDYKGQAQATMLVLSQQPISPDVFSDVAIGAISILSNPGTGFLSTPQPCERAAARSQETLEIPEGVWPERNKHEGKGDIQKLLSVCKKFCPRGKLERSPWSAKCSTA
jgi:hypothetical protein